MLNAPTEQIEDRHSKQRIPFLSSVFFSPHYSTLSRLSWQRMHEAATLQLKQSSKQISINYVCSNSAAENEV